MPHAKAPRRKGRMQLKSAIIAARAGIDLLTGQSIKTSLLAEARVLLEQAASNFSRLEQRLGEAQAYFGLMELVMLEEGQDTLRVSELERGGQKLLARTPFSDFPLELQALPWHMFLLMELF